MDGFQRLTSLLPPRCLFSVSAICLALLVTSLFASPADARVRVETGRDLVTFCQQAIDQALADPDARIRGKARYCRQYVSGFFSSLQAMQANEGTHKIHPNDDTERYQCALVPRDATYQQLERQILRFGEWHPELLDEPAIRLIQRAFDSLDPC